MSTSVAIVTGASQGSGQGEVTAAGQRRPTPSMTHHLDALPRPAAWSSRNEARLASSGLAMCVQAPS